MLGGGASIGQMMLPDGWDVARIREHVPGARLVDPSTQAVFSVVDGEERVPLEASTIIDCDGLFLVLADPDHGWWMGEQDRAGGSIICWGTYAAADDLGAALAAL